MSLADALEGGRMIDEKPGEQPLAPTPGWMQYLRTHPGSHVPLMIVVGLLTVIVTPLIAYGCWWWLLPRLWAWGFTPTTWRAVVSVLGAFYLLAIPLGAAAVGVQAFLMIMAAASGVPPAPTEAEGPDDAPAVAHTFAVERPVAPRHTSGRAAEKFRLALLVFGFIPIVVGLVALGIYVNITWNLASLRWIFLVVVVLFPATLYYLFNVSRRYSILTDLVANLDRVGLLACANGAREETRQKRVLSYIRKFESTYGPLNAIALKEIQLAAALDHTPEPIDETGDDPRPLSAVLHETRIPVVLATILIAVGWAVALPPLEPAATWEAQFSPTRGPISFAFLGAYFFSIQMLLRRYVRRDLSSTAFTGVSLRIILATIGTWVVVYGVDGLGIITSAKLTDEGRLVTAFSIGLLPVIVIQALAEVSKKLFAWARVMESLRNSFPTSRLDGLSVWHASRLEEEDLENVHGMATADVLELMIQTRLPPDRIVEWVDQAVLYSQMADAQPGAENLTDKLKRNGIRTATALLVGQDQEADRLEQLFTPEERACLSLAGRAIRTKPNLEPILRWRGIDVRRFPAIEPPDPLAALSAPGIPSGLAPSSP